MEIVSVSSQESLAHKASEWIQRHSTSRKAQSIFLPAGQTPIPLYEYWNQSKPEFLSSMKLLQVDDVITGSSRGMFKNFFEEHLSQFKTNLQGIEDDLPIADLAVLGLGSNGHVAFHEPGIPPEFFGGCVQLCKATCEGLNIENNSWGLTYGLASFLSSQSILLIVSGKSKQEIFKRFLEEEKTFPATYLKGHVRLTVIADEDAIGETLDFT